MTAMRAFLVALLMALALPAYAQFDGFPTRSTTSSPFVSGVIDPSTSQNISLGSTNALTISLISNQVAATDGGFKIRELNNYQGGANGYLQMYHNNTTKLVDMIATGATQQDWNVYAPSNGGQIFGFRIINGALSLPGYNFGASQIDSYTAANLNIGTGVGGATSVTIVPTLFKVKHAVGNTGTPTSPTAGAGCGTSSAPTNSGTDLGGTLGATCGATGSTASAIITITFATAYGAAPVCTIIPANAATAAIAVGQGPFPTTTTTTLAVTSNATGLVAGTYLWTYHCVQ